jgi:hypothetical protein
MWEHEHYNHSTESYWQLQIRYGIRNWWQDVWAGYTPERIKDEFGNPIERGEIIRTRERNL